MGEEPVGNACRAHAVKVVLLAADTAENSRKKAEKYAAEANVPLVTLPADKGELGFALGRKVCALAALTETGFAAGLLRKLAAADPGGYGELAQSLAAAEQEEAGRRKARQAEQRRRERNARKPWAAPAKKSGRPDQK